MNNNEKILDSIYSQISSFDNKSSLLLTVIGIIFGLSINFLDLFHLEIFIEASYNFRIAYKILFVLFIISFVVSIVFLILVFIPRKHKDNIKYPNYYDDIIKMNEEELKTSINKYYSDDKLINLQIKINAQICEKKHRWLIISIYSLIPFILLLLSLVFMGTFYF